MEHIDIAINGDAVIKALKSQNLARVSIINFWNFWESAAKYNCVSLNLFINWSMNIFKKSRPNIISVEKIICIKCMGDSSTSIKFSVKIAITKKAMYRKRPIHIAVNS